MPGGIAVFMLTFFKICTLAARRVFKLSAKVRAASFELFLRICSASSKHNAAIFVIVAN